MATRIRCQDRFKIEGDQYTIRTVQNRSKRFPDTLSPPYSFSTLEGVGLHELLSMLENGDQTATLLIREAARPLGNIDGVEAFWVNRDLYIVVSMGRKNVIF